MNRTNISMTWLATLNFSKGVPYVIVMVISLLMLRQMGLRPAVITLLVGLCYLPWVLKVWWKPFVERLLRGSLWVLITQMLLSVSFAAMAFAFPSEGLVVGLLMLIAWLTAIHNVAVDRLSAKAEETAPHRMTRELSRKFAMVIGQGVLVMLAGNLQVFYRHDMLYAWRLMFYLVSGLFLLLFFWHTLTLFRVSDARERPAWYVPSVSRPLVLVALFLFPLAQAMIIKVSILFLTDTKSNGGLGLSPQEFGLVMGTVGIIALTVGGLMGKKVIQYFGFMSCLWPMTLLMLAPSVIYVGLSYWQPDSLVVVSICVLLEQMAYGVGFALYLWLLQQIAWREQGKSLMALSLMMGCIVSGFIQEALGYNGFFIASLVISGLMVVSASWLRKIPINK